MAANSMNAKGVFILANRALAVAYVALAGLIVRALLLHDISLVGSTIFALLFLALAFGHFLFREWALKSSAAIFVVVVLLAIPYLFSTYERELVPGLHARLAHFSLISLLALLMVLNYLFYRKLEKTGRSAR